MKLATWNVNSVKARLERLLKWLGKTRPDVLCLQELKQPDEAFPREEIAALGYHAAVHGQRTYNGVAILSRVEPANVLAGLDDDVDDPQARLIAADVSGVRVLSAYFPNGSEVGSEKFAYKLDWMRRLGDYLDRCLDASMPVVMCGDFNVAVDDSDVAHPDAWAGSVLCVPQVREALEKIRKWGFIDVFRRQHPSGGIYSWWDYRRGAFRRNDGIRLDHVFATEAIAARCTAASVDRDQRDGEKPSDHAPVIVTFAD